MKILAIETSCDETAIALAECSKNKFKILANELNSQVKTHKRFGGVVPNLAKREHQRNLVPLLINALKKTRLLNLKFKIQNSKGQTKIQKIDKILEREPELFIQVKKFLVKYQKPKIDAVAITYGPGLDPALWTGINFAKTLACFWKLPLIRVNHMEGHFFSFLLSLKKEVPKFYILNSIFPVIALLASGGHTEFVYSPSLLKYKLIGETLDDAAGEAFDKGARLLKLSYPGGPELSKLAEKGNPKAFNFPRPMINSQNLNFSFSGLKTALLYKIQSLRTLNVQNIAASYQQAIIDTLVSKTIKAVKKCRPKSLILGGGVANNELLRKTLKEKIKKDFPKIKLFLPKKKFTTDNASMIALAGYFHLLKKEFIKPEKLSSKANLRWQRSKNFQGD